MPSVGEITPYVSNKLVQNMFQDNMGYWTISESIANINVEKQLLSYEKDNNSKLTGINLTEGEMRQAINWIKSSNLLYLDRSLMIKQDISKKVIGGTPENLDEIQNLASTRWMIPLMMKQFRLSEDNYNYVLTSLADLYDNMSNLYWLYNSVTLENLGSQGTRHHKVVEQL